MVVYRIKTVHEKKGAVSMKNKKRMMLRLFFACEILLFCVTYFFGAHGITSLHRTQQASETVARQLASLEQEIAALEGEIAAWNSNAFYKEKVAREELQMARAHEHIFYLV